MRGLFWAPESPISGRNEPEPFAYRPPAPILSAMTVHFPFENTYAALPANFFARVAPDARRRAAADQAEPAAGRRARARSRPAGEPGRRRDPRRQARARRAPSRSRWPMPATSSAISCRSSATAAPSCSARSSTRDGVRRDIQLKGSGPTPFSRRGDGRAALGPVLREYIVSEAMAALGIPTTRSLAAVTTGERVSCARPCCPARC